LEAVVLAQQIVAHHQQLLAQTALVLFLVQLRQPVAAMADHSLALLLQKIMARQVEVAEAEVLIILALALV
jgi:hypothetical protein